MRRIFILLSITSLFIGFLPGEQTSLSGPIEGFTFDVPTRSFRAVVGFPGSASLGPPILTGFGHGSVAPQKDYGLAFSDDQIFFISGLNSAGPSSSALSDPTAHPEVVAWSGDGLTAVLFSRSGNWIQVLTGFPNAPTAGPSTDFSFLGGSLSA